MTFKHYYILKKNWNIFFNKDTASMNSSFPKLPILLFIAFLLPTITIAHAPLLTTNLEENCALRAEVLIHNIPVCGASDGSVTLNVTGGREHHL